MTTIAYKDNIMVADTQTSNGNYITSNQSKKIFRYKNYVIGIAGDASGHHLLKTIILKHKIKKILNKKLLKKSTTKQLEHLNKHCSVLLVTPQKKIYQLQNCGFCKIKENYAAIGSGSQIAKTAMYLGKSAKEAVEVAGKLDCYTNNYTTVEKL